MSSTLDSLPAPVTHGKSTARGKFVGLDGCRSGWIAAAWDGPGSTLRFDPLARFAPSQAADAEAIGIDIPIGLPESGRRACDLAARAALPAGARSRVFLDLRRPLLRYLPAGDYAGANAWAKRDGHGLSKQAWFILPKVAEVDAALRPADQARVFETHPEVAFHRLNGGRLLPNKKTAAGRQARLALLAEAGASLPDGWQSLFPRRAVRPDDLLDAAVCALTARRIATGTVGPLALEGVPGARGRDARGLAMEIWG